MDLQTVIVALIILGALAFAGNSLRQKLGAFRPKDKSCGTNCGCEKK